MVAVGHDALGVAAPKWDLHGVRQLPCEDVFAGGRDGLIADANGAPALGVRRFERVQLHARLNRNLVRDDIRDVALGANLRDLCHAALRLTEAERRRSSLHWLDPVASHVDMAADILGRARDGPVLDRPREHDRAPVTHRRLEGLVGVGWSWSWG